MKVKSFNNFLNESVDISSIFKGLHGALDVDSLVPLKNKVGMTNFPSEEEVSAAADYLGINKDDLYYDPNNPLNPIIYLNGPFYYGFHGIGLDVLKMMKVKEYFEQKQNWIDSALAKKDYRKLFTRVDKKNCIPYFIASYKQIPDDQKYDIFKDLYIRSEYGFSQFPKAIISDLFTKRHLSHDWKNRMEEFKKLTGGKEIIKVYRGQTTKSTDESHAYSWTLSKKTASFFAKRFSGDGKVIERDVKASEVLDYLSDRGESEVLLMPAKFLKESRIVMFEDFEPEPIGLAILGAPAGGKGHTKKLVSKMTELINIMRATDPEIGIDLTVDVLRGKILQMPAKDQLDLFYMAFYTMKEMSSEEEYAKWFEDIKKVWTDKIARMAGEVDIEATDEDLFINGKTGEDALKELDKVNAKEIISNLDDYKDYKRIVRAYQKAKQDEAEGNKKDVVFDEVGDEPKKIIDRLKSLRKKDYVTDVILIHHDDVASNLMQNAQRMVVGNDGGRDSSDSILDAYNNIDKGLSDYEKNAEVSVTTTNKDLGDAKGKAADELAKATTKDNHENPDKTIDVFVRTKGEIAKEVFQRIKNNLDAEQFSVFISILKYQIDSEKLNIPKKPKDILQHLIGDISNSEALDILERAYNGKLKHNYVHQFGGVNGKLIMDARKTLE